MFLHVAYHWIIREPYAEGFADSVVNVARAPASPADIDALKTLIAGRVEQFDAELITLLSWNVLEHKTS